LAPHGELKVFVEDMSLTGVAISRSIMQPLDENEILIFVKIFDPYNSLLQ